MTTKVTLILFLLCSTAFSQCMKADPYIHNCVASPLWSEHGFGVDALRLADTKVGEWTPYNIPFWMITNKGNTRPFELDAFEVDPVDRLQAGIYLGSYCGTPQIPPGIGHNNLNCQMIIFWKPLHAGLQTFRLYFKAHYLDDGTDATHTVFAIGVGIK